MSVNKIYPHEICDLYENTGIETFNRGDYEYAEQLFKAALDYSRKCNEPYESLAVKMNNLAAVYYNQGIYQQAEMYYRQAMDCFNKHLGMNHPNLITILNNYSILLRKTGRSLEAEGLDICSDVLHSLPNTVLTFLGSYGIFFTSSDTGSSAPSSWRPISLEEQHRSLPLDHWLLVEEELEQVEVA